MGALIDLNGLGHYKSKENAMVASVYSATKTYAVGDYAYYNGTLYRCTTAITTAEAWTSGHWTAAKIGDDVTELKTAFSKYEGVTETPFTDKSGKKFINSSGSIVSASGTFHVTEPIPVVAGDLVSFYARGNNGNFAMISTCNSDSTGISPKVISTTTNLLEYKYTVASDGYIILSYNYSYTAELNIIKDYANIILDERIDKNDENLAVVNDLLREAKNLKSLYIVEGKYIALNGTIGSAVDVNNPVTAQGYGYIVYPCRIGDTFTLSGVGGSASRVWGFTDTDYKLLSRSVADLSASNVVLTAEANGYFISNVNTNYNYSLSAVLYFKPATTNNIATAIGEYFPISTYRKDFKFIASDLSEYIHVNHGDFDLFTIDTTASQVITAFNALASGSNGYMTADELGYASDGTTTLYSYTLQPLTEYTGLTFYIISGQHGFEKSSVFGLYYFFRELIENYASNPSLMYLRNWVKIICIPLMNPYGFDNMSYLNANGVNLNLNWDTPYWTQGTQGTSSYGGASAGDQPETQYATAIMDENADDIFWFSDFHTQGSEVLQAYTGCVWHAFGTDINGDDYTKIGINAAKKHINELSSRFCIDYSTDCPTYTTCGSYSLTYEYSHSARAAVYARVNGIQGETIEGFPGFPNGQKYSPTCHQANADVIANWMRCIISAYEREGGE